ncbi:TPA: hypothetical protein PXO03_001539 [Yersinia enterocolitica]|nr:hypothetical protein [Yersinia enterocolitica]HDL7465571.1 hypothetical protein [Yersinia enterocolitica]
MEIVFDLIKNKTNKQKHAVYLADAEHLDWERMAVVPDYLGAYGEDCYIQSTQIHPNFQFLFLTISGCSDSPFNGIVDHWVASQQDYSSAKCGA